MVEKVIVMKVNKNLQKNLLGAIAHEIIRIGRRNWQYK